MKKSIIGQNIKCRICQSPDAIIQLIDRRFMVYCLHCSARGLHEYLLKEQHLTKNPQSIGEIMEKAGYKIVD